MSLASTTFGWTAPRVTAHLRACPPAEAPKAPKAKARLERDSVTMPPADFDLIAALKSALERLTPRKPGRPKKDA